MGSFYTNIALKAAEQERVLDALAGRDAFVSGSVNGYVFVYDRESEQQGPTITELAHDLSQRLGVIALAALNHDDDLLFLQVYDQGDLVDEYNSSPGFPDELKPPEGGDVDRLSAVFGVADKSRLQQILRSDKLSYVLELDRHKDLASALGLPQEPCVWGYNYLEREVLLSPFKDGSLRKPPAQ